MKKMYREYFKVSREEKIRDKVMLGRVFLSVAIILGCLIAMSFSAYAYFSNSITSGFNKIEAGSYAIELTVTDGAGNAVTPVTSNHKAFRLEGLTAGTEYTVTATPLQGNSVETGFLLVRAENATSEVYHTWQLGVDKTASGGRRTTVAFTFSLSQDANVLIFAHWGTSSCYAEYIKGVGDRLYVTDTNNDILINVDAHQSSLSVESSTNEDTQQGGSLESAESSTQASSEAATSAEATSSADSISSGGGTSSAEAVSSAEETTSDDGNTASTVSTTSDGE